MIFHVTLEQAEDGRKFAGPAFQGKDEQEALENIKEAITGRKIRRLSRASQSNQNARRGRGPLRDRQDATAYIWFVAMSAERGIVKLR
ncbi:MAG: type II toxin-antitoxin system HicB family antitoxin [Gammaproteobacteria bacterium]